MSHITICGTAPLRGEISLQRAKNSVLPVLAATLLHRGQSCIRDCPVLSDVEAAIDILRHLGCPVAWQGRDLLVDASSLTGCTIPPALMHRCRASVLFLGALLGRCGEAELSFPGGCFLGPRPIDMHLSALQALGTEITVRGERLRCCAPHLCGREIRLPFPSVGATENAMLAAAAAEGVTVISNAAREPEIADLQTFLQKMGVHIHGAGTSTVAIRGSQQLRDAHHRCIGDRIVAATYLCATAATGGQITVKDADYRHLSPVLTALQQAGCTVRSTADTITLSSNGGHLRAVDTVRTAPYPGFPTDAQPLLMAALLRARGETTFIETMFENRYRHVPQLRKMGADICLADRCAAVCGVERLCGAQVSAPDLRGGAALMIAALSAEGTTQIHDIHHILRGYEDVTDNFRALGAQINQGNNEGGDIAWHDATVTTANGGGADFPCCISF